MFGGEYVTYNQCPSVTRRLGLLNQARQLFPYDKPVAAADLIAVAKELEAFVYGEQNVQS